MESRATSRAVQFSRFGGPEVLEVVDRDDPEPGPGQVRLAVAAAAVNPFDWKVRTGAFAGDKEAPDQPTIGGSDLAGTVEALGDGVTEFAVGDAVFGQATGGAFAEKAIAATDRLWRKPAEVSWEIACSLPVIVTTAYRVLQQIGLGDAPPARTLLINGATGGVGTIATQLAVLRGHAVIGTTAPDTLDDVTALGGVPVTFGPGLPDRVRPLAPQGVDLAFDTAGKGALGDLVAITGSPDRVITISDPDAELHGVRFSTGGIDSVPGALDDFVALLAAGRARMPEVVRYRLEDLAQAQEDNRTGRVLGKLVLSIA